MTSKEKEIFDLAVDIDFCSAISTASFRRSKNFG